MIYFHMWWSMLKGVACRTNITCVLWVFLWSCRKVWFIKPSAFFLLSLCLSWSFFPVLFHLFSSLYFSLLFFPKSLPVFVCLSKSLSFLYLSLFFPLARSPPPLLFSISLLSNEDTSLIKLSLSSPFTYIMVQTGYLLLIVCGCKNVTHNIWDGYYLLVSWTIGEIDILNLTTLGLLIAQCFNGVPWLCTLFCSRNTSHEN